MIIIPVPTHMKLAQDLMEYVLTLKFKLLTVELLYYLQIGACIF